VQGRRDQQRRRFPVAPAEDDTDVLHLRR
jgi:hypothetical protein